MFHRLIIAWMLLAFAAPLAFAADKSFDKAQDKPNILFIFTDDQCFDTIAALGNDEIHTPNLDRLVQRGLTFTHAYNMGSYSGAVCIASRMMLNSGRFVWNAQRLHSAGEKERAAGRWWSQHMKKAGYETYMTGKWHLRASAQKSFEHQVHERPGMPNQTSAGYWRPVKGEPDKWSPYDKKFDGFWKGGKHWSEVLADDSEQFLANAAESDKPFFMYLAFNAPHDPRQAPKKFVDMYPTDKIKVPSNFLPVHPHHEAMGMGKPNQRALRDEKLAPIPRTHHAVQVNRAEYYALISHTDQQIGRILDALEKTGKADNTWIFFTADHGLSVGQHGLLGKQNMYDHSVRVPFIVVGPGVKPGSKNDTPIYLQDVMPTTLQLAGVDRPDHVEFKSLMPLIEGKKVNHYDAIYGAYLNDRQRMVTAGDWKLILYPRAKAIELYNLADDPMETKNLADDPAHQSKIRRLFNVLKQQQKIVSDPLDLTAVYPDL